MRDLKSFNLKKVGVKVSLILYTFVVADNIFVFITFCNSVQRYVGVVEHVP